MKTLLALLLSIGLAACAADSSEHAGEHAGEAMEHAGTMDHDATNHEDGDGAHMEHTDSAEMSEAAVGAAEAFRAAIVANDSTLAAAIILEDALILEGGGVETREHYLSGHFNGDGAFLSAMTRELKDRKVSVSGHAAWITTTSRLHGNYRDRDIDMTSAELLVLEHSDAGWKVAAVHWSSRQN
jgi:ketosteroid isomerase-like protein